MSDNKTLKWFEDVPLIGGIVQGVDNTSQFINGMFTGYYGVGKELAEEDLGDSPFVIVGGSVHVLLLGSGINWLFFGGYFGELLTYPAILGSELAAGYFSNKGGAPVNNNNNRGSKPDEWKKVALNQAVATKKAAAALKEQVKNDKPPPKLPPDLDVKGKDLNPIVDAVTDISADQKKMADVVYANADQIVTLNCTRPAGSADAFEYMTKVKAFAGFGKGVTQVCPKGYLPETKERVTAQFGWAVGKGDSNLWITSTCKPASGQVLDYSIPSCAANVSGDVIAAYKKTQRQADLNYAKNVLGINIP